MTITKKKQRYVSRLLILGSLFLLVLGSWNGCGETDTVVVSGAREIWHDAKWYPTTIGSVWRYRIDTTDASGDLVPGVFRRTTRIIGDITYDGKRYVVQVNEDVAANTVSFDTTYIRKADDGLYFSSPSLLMLSNLPGIPGSGSGIPRDFKLLPYPLESTPGWEIFNYDIELIPFFKPHIYINARNLGLETVVTEMQTFRDCLRIRIDLDILLPNPQDPTNIFNPLIIKEDASFWFGRPLGLVAGEGSQLLFVLLTGRLPLRASSMRTHLELTGMDIRQPASRCE